MEQHELRAWEAQCIQEEPPACQAGCPLGVDGRGFTAAMRTGDLRKARAVLEKHMPLAGIVGRLCEAPCEQHCLRRDLGGAIALGTLERTCVSTVASSARILRLPSRPKTVTILGGGPSSLTVAFDLARKGYPVTLYHEGTNPGGWLRDVEENLLPGQVLEEELQRLKELGICMHPLSILPEQDTQTADALFIGYDGITALDMLNPFVPAEAASPAELTSHLDLRTFALTSEKWFAGGISHLETGKHSLITDVFQGRQAAVSMDRFLQGASLTADRKWFLHGQTNLYTNTSAVTPVARLLPDAANGCFSLDKAREEAGRCIDCQCLECVHHCTYLREFGSYPRTYIRNIYNNSAIVRGVHQANTLINSCSLCRQCEKLCPTGFSMADICLGERRVMVAEERMPSSAHWFALEEMRSAHEGSLLRHAPEEVHSTRIFYPGCQLAGIRPEQTLALYDMLLAQDSQTGIWLDCCGAPAKWAGQEDAYAAIVHTMRKQWISMGRPQIITACSTCLQGFREALPEIPVQSVWTLLAETPPSFWNLCPGDGTTIPLKTVAISDPCTSRDDEETRAAVRTLLTRLGHTVEPLTMSEMLTECCGFGGLMDNANPVLSRKVAEDRIKQTEAEILTYCAMCRDQLAKTGHPVSHILDLIFPDLSHPAVEAPQSLSARRCLRRQLVAEVLARYTDASSPVPQPWQRYCLKIPEYVARAMEERRILVDDIKQVLYAVAQGQGLLLAHGKKRHHLAMAVLGEVSFWVEYSQRGEFYVINRCWSHRMQIRR